LIELSCCRINQYTKARRESPEFSGEIFDCDGFDTSLAKFVLEIFAQTAYFEIPAKGEKHAPVYPPLSRAPLRA
jgi:hypothetical protein